MPTCSSLLTIRIAAGRVPRAVCFLTLVPDHPQGHPWAACFNETFANAHRPLTHTTSRFNALLFVVHKLPETIKTVGRNSDENEFVIRTRAVAQVIHTPHPLTLPSVLGHRPEFRRT